MSVPSKIIIVLQWGIIWIFYVQTHFAVTKELKIVFLVDSVQKDINNDIAASVKEIEEINLDMEIKDSILIVDNMQDEDEVMKTFCQIVSTEGVSVIIDFTYQQWNGGLSFINAHQIPYLHVERLLNPFLKMFGVYLQQKDANDVALIFQNEQDTIEALYHMIDGFAFRTMIVNAADNSTDFVQRLKQLRPSPSYLGIFASGSNMNSIFERVSNGNLFERPTEWHFVFLDSRDRDFKFDKMVEFATKFTIDAKQLCRSMQMKDAYCSSGFKFQRAVILEIFRSLIDAMQLNANFLEPMQYECTNDTSTLISYQSNSELFDLLKFYDFMYLSTDEELNNFQPTLTYAVNVSVNSFSNELEANIELAAWKAGVLLKINETISPAKRFFRIGTTEAIPWSYYRRDIRTGEILLDDNGSPIWEGYCIDFIATLSEKLQFGYEIISPTEVSFGDRDPITGKWNGIVGDLVSGETDLAVAALKMYSEREEVIDFIAPYFEQTGISIVIRKPVRQTSLFKFMTVLRLEVWLSIIAALVTTAFMIWILDKYSPYSSRNNKQSYPYPCREFTLRESFWFALTSFTPQGGGEAPKAVSGRILVAAYWLFVVLMLATFTANLAAFLTVERMQTPVQSLEQLARQSRINYTVVANSDTHQYFINMKFAEDTLYRMWKELALNATTDFARYRIWDYPIKEQYGQILLAINGSNPVYDAAEGFRKVNEHENADFAFIHDSSEIKYEVTHNCNFTEVGEVFAEQPYAIAVQQGSHLADEFTYALLELQKDRYFEELKAKYWNRSRLKDCALSDNQEGITLESLGGVFIATLFGLGLAMLTLAGEVFYYKRKHANWNNLGNITKVIPIKDVLPQPRKTAWFIGKNTTVSKRTPPPSFESVTFRGKNVPQNITLGGTEFRPRRTGMLLDSLRSLGMDSNDDLSTRKSELTPYVE